MICLRVILTSLIVEIILNSITISKLNIYEMKNSPSFLEIAVSSATSSKARHFFSLMIHWTIRQLFNINSLHHKKKQLNMPNLKQSILIFTIWIWNWNKEWNALLVDGSTANIKQSRTLLSSKLWKFDEKAHSLATWKTKNYSIETISKLIDGKYARKTKFTSI